MICEKAIVGRTEYVWIVMSGQKRIPARIDTGARTTAIWASNIREIDGELSWEFFAKGSEFYTGETFSTQNFEKRNIQSSTGHQEIRYRIPIILQIKKRRIKTFANLSNRTHATFPILIGRNTLSGKFIVDVQRSSRKLLEMENAKSEQLQNDNEGEK